MGIHSTQMRIFLEYREVLSIMQLLTPQLTFVQFLCRNIIKMNSAISKTFSANTLLIIGNECGLIIRFTNVRDIAESPITRILQ